MNNEIENCKKTLNILLLSFLGVIMIIAIVVHIIISPFLSTESGGL